MVPTEGLDDSFAGGDHGEDPLAQGAILVPEVMFGVDQVLLLAI